MNLHLLWDEKITGRIIKTFESVLSNQNQYIIWVEDKESPKFASPMQNVYLISEDENFPKIDYTAISKVIIHGLDLGKIKFCQEKISNKVPLYWLLWGAELYNSLLFSRGYKLYYKDHPPYSVKSKIVYSLKRLGYIEAKAKQILNFINSHDMTMVCSKIEYDIFRRHYPGYTRHLKNESNYFYYPVDEILGNHLKNKQVSGNIILVGNSCSWTNNHRYVFDKVRHLNLKGRQIVTPISYGGDDDYRDTVVKIGRKYFGESFQPLTKFLPLDEYNNIMTHAEICIYGNWRQEAVGNIIISLYLGAKVYLSKRSPLVEIFKSQGLTVFILEDIKDSDFLIPIDKNLKQRNREIILRNNSWERLKKQTVKIFG